MFGNNSHVNCVATNVNLNSVGPISSLQINVKGPGGMVVNSVGPNGLISTGRSERAYSQDAPRATRRGEAWEVLTKPRQMRLAFSWFPGLPYSISHPEVVLGRQECWPTASSNPSQFE